MLPQSKFTLYPFELYLIYASILFYKAHTNIKSQTLKSLTNNLANNFNYYTINFDMVRLVIKCTIQIS